MQAVSIPLPSRADASESPKTSADARVSTQAIVLRRLILAAIGAAMGLAWGWA